jgi:hypothetical protein
VGLKELRLGEVNTDRNRLPWFDLRAITTVSLFGMGQSKALESGRTNRPDIAGPAPHRPAARVAT